MLGNRRDLEQAREGAVIRRATESANGDHLQCAQCIVAVKSRTEPKVGCCVRSWRGCFCSKKKVKREKQNYLHRIQVIITLESE